MTEYRDLRIINGKPTWVIINEMGKIINKHPDKKLVCLLRHVSETNVPKNYDTKLNLGYLNELAKKKGFVSWSDYHHHQFPRKPIIIDDKEEELPKKRLITAMRVVDGPVWSLPRNRSDPLELIIELIENINIDDYKLIPYFTHGAYVLYTDIGIYVGASTNIRNRIERWKCADITINAFDLYITYPGKVHIFEVERYLINKLKPELNKQKYRIKGYGGDNND